MTPGSHVLYFDKVVDNIEKVHNFNDNIIMMGDFNNDVPETILSILVCNNLFNYSQLITEPTRVSPKTNSTIDLKLLLRFAIS